MQTKIYTDQNVFTELKTEWLTLFEKSNTPAFFLHPIYQELWWKHLSHGQLHVITVRDDQQHLIGLLPLYLDVYENKRTLRIIGAVDETDYLDILTCSKDKPQVDAELVKALTKDINKWDEIKLESLLHQSSTLTEFKDELTNNNLSVTQEQQEVCPVITLPNSWDNYLQSLEPKQAKTFKKLLRSIGAEDEISYELINSNSDINQAAADFINLHKLSGEDKKSFWTPAREAFFTELCVQFQPSGLLKLYFLLVNGERAATLLVFDYQNQFLLYNSGFDAYRYGYLGVSNALILQVIKEAIEHKRTRYDFMRGDETYKFSFGAVSEPLYDLVITKK